MYNILLSVVYAILGIILMFAGFKFFDFITPFDFNKEIEENNPAMGIVILGIFISIAIIVVAAIK